MAPNVRLLEVVMKLTKTQWTRLQARVSKLVKMAEDQPMDINAQLLKDCSWCLMFGISASHVLFLLKAWQAKVEIENRVTIRAALMRFPHNKVMAFRRMVSRLTFIMVTLWRLEISVISQQAVVVREQIPSIKVDWNVRDTSGGTRTKQSLDGINRTNVANQQRSTTGRSGASNEEILRRSVNRFNVILVQQPAVVFSRDNHRGRARQSTVMTKPGYINTSIPDTDALRVLGTIGWHQVGGERKKIRRVRRSGTQINTAATHRQRWRFGMMEDFSIRQCQRKINIRTANRSAIRGQPSVDVAGGTTGIFNSSPVKNCTDRRRSRIFTNCSSSRESNEKRESVGENEIIGCGMNNEVQLSEEMFISQMSTKGIMDWATRSSSTEGHINRVSTQIKHRRSSNLCGRMWRE
jgi:hypothetical protein